MNFLSPWSLLWLLPLAAAIIFLYLLKLKRVPRVVSSVLLWNLLAADIQANAPFQKLRKNLLLFLQLLTLLLIIGALARPFMRATGLEGQSVVLVLDASGSMKSTDVSGSRFDRAKKIALKAVDDLGRGDVMMVITASAKTRVVAPFTSDRRALAAAINALECKDTTTHLQDALRLADSLCARKKNAQIMVLSDGAFPPLSNPIASKAKLTFVCIGQRMENVAITALGARRALSSDASEVFVATQNFSPESKTFTVELYRDGQLLDAREQTLAANARGAEVFKMSQSTSGMITAKLDAADDLAADNTASIFLTRHRQSSVLLITKGDLFLERALMLDATLNVVKIASPGKASESYDLVIVEGMDGLALPKAKGYLFINSLGDMAPVEAGKTTPNPTIVDWNRNDPVSRYVDLGGVRIAEAREVSIKPWGRSLAEAQGGSLIAAGEHNGARAIFVGWDLLRSDFPLRVGFPIFLSNCVDWLTQPTTAREEIAVSPGDVVSIPLPADLSKVRLTYPDGKIMEIPADNSPLMIEDTESAGIYKVEGKKLNYRFAVNMLNREESNTKPVNQISLAGMQVSGSRSATQTNKELWRWLVILGLVLITLEWIVYHRRP